VAAARAADRIDLNQREYLLLDDRLVADAQGVTLRLGPVKKHPANPLMREDKPWELRYDNVYANVLYDESAKLFKCFYSPFIIDEATANTSLAERARKKYHVTPTREMGLCYAHSEDGIHWTKPELGIVELNGNTRNNLVLRSIHGAGVFIEPNDPDANKRYKLFAGSQVPGKDRFMIVGFSADGTHWTNPMRCSEIESEGDTHNNALWAEQLKSYVGFTREFREQRLVMRTESHDFIHWSKAAEVVRGDRINQTYAMQAFATHGIYLGILAIFNTQSDRVHGELAVSDDTIHWRRVCPGVPLVPNSERPGDYDYGCVYVAKSPLNVGDDVRIYYGASNAPHSGWRDGCLALATLRRGRWAGYEHDLQRKVSGAESGRITTVPIICRGRKLRVNVLAPHGSLQVGVVGHSRLSTNACKPIRGDTLCAEVEWDNGADLSKLVGKPVQCEFKITNGVLYEFRFTD